MTIKKQTFMLIAAICFSVASWGQTPYTALSQDDTVLTFYYDNNFVSRSGHPLIPYLNLRDRPWAHAVDKITTVVFDDSFANYQTLTHTFGWFALCKKLTTIIGIKNLKTNQVTNMGAMFDHCSSLTSVDLSGFSTSNVQNMFNMFYGCTSLISLDLHSFNTYNLEVTSGMFNGCTSLTTLDLSSFKTDKLETIHTMFKNCSNLKTIYVGKDWNPSKVSNGTDVFLNCNKLVGGKGTTYNETRVNYYYAIVDGGTAKPGYFTLNTAQTPEQLFRLGYDHYTGRNGKAKDYKKAVEYYRQAADQGHAGAQANLGLMLRKGQGISVNLQESIMYFAKAAAQGDVTGQVNLGWMYDTGTGITQDNKEAVKWYRKAAEQGDAAAQYNLGLCYEQGKGVSKDMGQAKIWYAEAAAQGHRKAIDKLK